MKWSDVTPFTLWTAVVVTLGLAMMGGPLWPLCVAGFLLLLYAVANEAPEPVRHDLGMPARLVSYHDAPDTIANRIHAQMVADGLIRDPSAHTRLGDV